MKKEEVKEMLARYFDGQSSEEEEKALYRFFLAADDLPEELQAERSLFLSLHGDFMTEVVVPDGLEATLERLIDRKAASSRRRWLRWGGIAASFLLLLGGSVLFVESRQEPQDTFTNPEDAHRALQAIFMEMSQTWEEGMEQIEASQKDIMIANREIRNEFKQ